MTLFNKKSLKQIYDGKTSEPYRALFLITSLLVTSAVATAFAQMEDPMVDTGNTQKLASHSWVILDQNIPLVPNIGIVVGSHSTLVIDTGTGPANGDIVYDAAVKLQPTNKLYLATTHVHPEHDLGASAFPESTIMIRSDAQQREITTDGLTLSRNLQNKYPKLRELLSGTEFRAADVTFSDRYELDLGGVTVVITAVGPAHTLGDTAFYVVEDSVLYAGELLVNAVPNLDSQFSNVDNWSASLDRLAELNAEIIVPGHGELVNADIKITLQEFFNDLMTRSAGLNTDIGDRSFATDILIQELSEKYADWASDLDPEYFNSVIQSAATSAFKSLDRRTPAGSSAN